VDLDPALPGDEVLKVYAVPFDQHHDPIKAAGSFVVEAFDLSIPDDNRLGRWEFDLAESGRHWTGQLFSYYYVLPCPWERAPLSDQITVRVTFRDALTGREFTEQKVLSIIPPRRGSPSTSPSR
jgi:hypothetical protein